MKTVKLLAALTDIGDDLVEQAAPKKRRKLRLNRLAAFAACLALVILLGGTAIDRLGLFRAGCSAWPGTFADGRYYYIAGHGSLYCWDGEGSRLVLHTLLSEESAVNDYGVYYRSGRRIYVIPHDTGRRRLLYTAPLRDRSHIAFAFYGEDVVVRVYNKWKEHLSEVLVDGRTGAVLEQVEDRLPYAVLHDSQDWQSTHYRLGDRQLVLVPTEEEHAFLLTENGEPLLEQTVFVGADSFSDQLWFYLREGDGSSAYIVRADGEDTLLEAVPDNGTLAAAGGYAYWVEYEPEAVWCMDTHTGERWQLPTDTETELYDLTTDGELLFTCVPWNDYQALWRVETDADGRPVALTLLDGDITE